MTSTRMQELIDGATMTQAEAWEIRSMGASEHVALQRELAYMPYQYSAVLAAAARMTDPAMSAAEMRDLNMWEQDERQWRLSKKRQWGGP